MSKLFGNFIGFILLISCLYGQEAQTVTATGFGAILGGDKVKANEDATNDALRKAVEQVVGILMDSHTITENFMLLEDKIYTKTQGYVQSYTVVSSREREDNSLEVTVQAVVKTARCIRFQNA